MSKKESPPNKENTARLVASIVRQMELTGMTRAQLHEKTGISLPAISRLFKAKGDFKMDTALRIAEAVGVDAPDLVGPFVPMAGTVSAGGGADDPADPGDTLPVTKLMPFGTVAYRVVGTSMEDVHIADGDHVLVRPCDGPTSADVGEKVVVYVPDKGALVKIKRTDHYASACEKAPRDPIPFVEGRHEYGVLIGVVRKVEPPKKRKGK